MSTYFARIFGKLLLAGVYEFMLKHRTSVSIGGLDQCAWICAWGAIFTAQNEVHVEKAVKATDEHSL
jgi:hypothetical protein